MSPLSAHRRTVARCAALLGVAAVASAVALHTVIPHEHPDVAHAADALAQVFRTVNLAPGEGAQLNCRNGALGPLVPLPPPPRVAQTRAQVVCNALLPPAPVSPTSTATRTVTATQVLATLTATLQPGTAVPSTSTRLPTSPPLPTATGVPTLIPPAATGTPTGALIEGVSICTNHEPNRWHPLVERQINGAIRCTYGHEHHGNPHDVDDLFGPPGAWWGSAQDISYPWQTFSFTATGATLESPPPPGDPSIYENARKHNGYKWYVKRDLPCHVIFNADGCFRAFRVQVHSLGAQTDTVTRFHSYSAEVLVERNGQQGILRGGGWINTGHLGLFVDGGNGVVCPPLDTNPPANTFTCPRNNTSGNFRESGSISDVPAPHTAHANGGATTQWYAGHPTISIAPAVQMWGPTSYLDPARQLYYPPEYRANNATGGRINMTAILGPLAQDPVPAGGVSGRVYLNRHGWPEAACTAVGLDCIPFVAEHVSASTTHWHDVSIGPDAFFPSWDVLSPITGASLVSFPN